MKAVVVLNEQHTLLPDQERVLLEAFESFEVFPVPATGWTRAEMRDAALLLDSSQVSIVFASPLPAMILDLARWNGQAEGEQGMPEPRVFVLHNDRREKKELPGGTVIMTVASEGWQIV